jgi:CubicO group peptidase (beta-lactamase class C family)
MMRNQLFLIPGIITIISLVSCETKETIDDSLPLKQKIDQLVEPIVIFGNPSAMIIGITQHGERSYYSYGNAGGNLGPPLPNSIFEIGSVTKTFTATLLSEFMMEDLVSLDDPITKYLPETIHPPTFNGQQITLKHLVTHTSGLPREIYNFNIGGSNVWSEIDNNDLYEFLNNIYQQAYPFDDYTLGNELQSLGTKYRYSNVGMALLGHILELASGKSYEQLVDERICTQLNMAETKIYPDLSQEQKDRVPVAYDMNQYSKAYDRDFGRYVACGGLLSTIDDMLNYMEANLEDSSPLSKAMQQCHQEIYTSEQISKENGDSDERFHRGVSAIGMAWFLSYAKGDTIVEHSGAFNHQCHFRFSKTNKVGIVAFSNSVNQVDRRVIETIFDWINE